MGASLSASSGRDYTTLSLRVRRKILERVRFIDEVLTQPSFPEEEIGGVEKVLAAIQSAEDEPGNVAQKEFQKTLFPQTPMAIRLKGLRNHFLGSPGRNWSDFTGLITIPIALS